MIDFSKLGEKADRERRKPEQLFWYACVTCGHATAYTIKLPAHLVNERCKQYVPRAEDASDFRLCGEWKRVQIDCPCETCRTPR